MSNSEEPEAEIKITAKGPKLTAPGYEIELSEAHAQVIAEFVGSPAFHILKKIFAAQRKDHIARMALNDAQDEKRLHYYKGMAAELVLLFKTLKLIKTKYNAQHDDEEAKNAKK